MVAEAAVVFVIVIVIVFVVVVAGVVVVVVCFVCFPQTPAYRSKHATQNKKSSLQRFKKADIRKSA